MTFSRHENNIAIRVRDIIKTTLGLSLSDDEFRIDTPLFVGGLRLDSVRSLDIVMALEDEFNIRIEDEDLEPGLFHSSLSLADLIERKLSSSGGAS